MRKKRIIVTGATGFLGKHLVPFLLKKHYDITILLRSDKNIKQLEWFNKVKILKFDLNHPQKLNFASKDIHGLIHLAWDNLSDYNSLNHIEKNLPNSFAFIKQILEIGVKNIFVLGTCLEYGLKEGALGVNSVTKPMINYSIAKDRLRKQLEVLEKKTNFNLQWARLFYVYGKGQKKSSLFTQLNHAIDNQLDEFKMSKGDQRRDFISVDEAIKQIYLIFNQHPPGTYNICSGKAIKVKSFVKNLLKKRNAEIKLNTEVFKYPNYEPFSFFGLPNVKNVIYLPTLPNSPLDKISSQQLGPICLRYSKKLHFFENMAYISNIIDYSKNYENSQAYSIKFKSHMTNIMKLFKKKFSKGSKIIEVGCGKGDFVELIQKDNYFKIKGFDASYEGKNKLIENRYLSENDKINADLVVLRHVLEHIPNPFKFLNMLQSIFGRTKIYIEVPNMDWILKNRTFFDITYEHVNYFSIKSFQKLFDTHTSEVELCFENQYQYIIADLDKLNHKFQTVYENENWTYQSFQNLFPNVNENISKLECEIGNFSAFIWGAATKGCLFLAHCKEQGKLLKKIKFAIDINPRKIGKYLPKSLVQIKNKQDFFNTYQKGDSLIITNPAYKDEILNELKINKVEGIKVFTL